MEIYLPLAAFILMTGAGLATAFRLNGRQHGPHSIRIVRPDYRLARLREHAHGGRWQSH